jgi:hypothetical protein
MPFAIYIRVQLSCRPIGVNSVVNILHIRGLLEIDFFRYSLHNCVYLFICSLFNYTFLVTKTL